MNLHSINQNGFALLPVVMGIALLGALTFMISRESAGNIEIARQVQSQASQRALLDTGLAHGKWMVMNSDCQIPDNQEDVNFDGVSYDLLFSGDEQDLDLSVTATLADGALLTDSEQGLVMYDYANPRQLEITTSDDAYMKLKLSKLLENSGDGTDFKVKRKSNDDKRGLIKFDVSQVPPDSLIDSAIVQLYMHTADKDKNDFAFHVVTEDWQEGSVTASNPWSFGNVGGAFRSTPELIVPGISNPGSTNFQFRSLVEKWVNQDIANYGLLLKMVTEGSSDGEYKFRSREHGNATQRPKLIVNYVCKCGVPCDLGIVLEDILITPENTVQLAGDAIHKEDLIRYSPSGPKTDLYFDGSLTGSNESIQGVHRLANNRLLLVLGATKTLNGIVFEPQDIIEYDANEGLFRMFMDGSDYGITEDLSSVSMRADNLPVVSLAREAEVLGNRFEASDLFAIDTQSRTTELVLQGSSHGIDTGIEAAHITAEGQFLLSFRTDISIGGVAVSKGDIVQYDAGTGTATAYFDGSQFSTATRVKALHAGKGSGSVSYTELHLPFETDSVGVTPDVIGSREATLIGPPDWVPGGVKGAYRFDGVDDEIQLANDKDLEFDSDFSVALWINHEGDRAGEQYLLTKQDAVEPVRFILGLRDGQLFWTLENKTDAVTFGPYSAPDAASWHHVIVTFDKLAGQAALYIDAELQELVDTDFETIRNPYDLRFGQGFEGVVDEIRIYKRALLDSEIKTLFKQAEPVPPDDADDDSIPLPAEESGASCEGSFADFFNASSYSNSDGKLSWKDPWNEYSDDGDPDSGRIRITNKRLRLSDSDRALYRKLPIAAASSVGLAFNVIDMSGFVSGGNHLAVYVSSTGLSGPWTELTQLTPGDVSPTAKQFSLDSFIGDDTWLSFDTSSDSSSFDWYEIDNVQVRCTP